MTEQEERILLGRVHRLEVAMELLLILLQGAADEIGNPLLSEGCIKKLEQLQEKVMV
jgi:hypothetical protein